MIETCSTVNKANSEITVQHDTTAGTTRRPQLGELIDDIRTTKWYRLGLELTNDEDGMRLIKDNHRNNAEGALEATFELWLEGDDCTWQAVVDALRKMKQMRLAADLEQKYCQ